MKEVVLISGKGGTGKTSLCSSLISINKQANFLICDCDVECPDLHIVLDPENPVKLGEISGLKAQIDRTRCIECRLCLNLCRFDAISDNLEVNAIDCEGCGLCGRLCAVEAISMIDFPIGSWYRMQTPYGPMLHGELGPGRSNSGQLVARMRSDARKIAEEQGLSLIITDGPPGTGCPVISAITGSSLAVIVTEPSLSARHDLERVIQLCQHFRIKFGVVINKSDIHPRLTEEIRDYCAVRGIHIFGEIPYREEIVQAIRNRVPPAEYSEIMRGWVQEIWHNMEVSLYEKQS